MRSRLHLRSILSVIAAVATLGLAATYAPASGLLVPNNPGIPPLRITDHLVSVSIDNGIARTELTQTFRNDTRQRLEATYIFPLPDGADLTNFQLSFNGKMVEGEVLPADQARHIYESIVRQMKDPGLIEFIGARLLRMRVFPIEPESDTTIVLKYQQVCTPLSNMQAYHYPLATRQTAGQAYGTVRFAVELNAASPLKNIWSPTHAVEIVRDGEYGAKIAYEAQGGSLEDDFLLLYNTDDSDLGLSVVTHKQNKEQPGHFVMMLTPKQLWPQQDKQPQDVVFVLDTSGSMAGDKLAQAKKSLNYCIKLLDARDRFSVVRFSTGFDVLFDGVSEASDERKKQATEWVDRFEAAGGTNIAATLRHVMTMRPTVMESGPEEDGVQQQLRPFVVVFLTDGQGNRTPEEIMATLSKAVGGTGVSPVNQNTTSVRIFPFGVGHDVNTKLLDRLANDYTGRPTYVQPGENLELVLGDFFGIISQPVLTDLKLELPGIGVTERFPATLGDLYHGQQLTIAGRFDSELTGPVKLTARRAGKLVEYSWPSVSFASSDDANYVETVWAGRKIAYLIDQIRLHGENNEMIAEIVALSTEHGIQTPYTSWLVNPEQLGRLAGTRAFDLSGRDELGSGVGGQGRPALRERLQSVDSLRRAASTPPPSGGSGGFGGGGGGGGSLFSGGDASVMLSLDEAEKAATAEAGRAATIVAGYTARLRDADNAGEFRLDQNVLPSIKINDIWYHRLGLFMVDGRVDEKTELIPIRFGSAAYFELVGNKALRPAMAKSKFIILKLSDTHAVAIVDDEEAAEEFTAEQREQIGLARR